MRTRNHIQILVLPNLAVTREIAGVPTVSSNAPLVIVGGVKHSRIRGGNYFLKRKHYHVFFV